MKATNQTSRRAWLVAGAVATAMTIGHAPVSAQIDGFQHVYGGSLLERGDGGVIRTNDGNVVAVGSTSSYGPTSDVMVVKMTTCGDVIWSYSYDLGGNDIGRKVRETSDGLIVVGSTQSLADGNSDGFIMKINTLGGWNWTRALGVDEPGKEDDLRDVRVDPATHDIYAAGFTNSSGAGNYDGWLLKLNPFGTLQWSRTYGRADEDLLLSLDMACNGRLVATGSTRSGTSGGDQDIYLVSVFPTNGVLVWSKRRGGSGDEQGTSIVANNDPLTGGFYVAGQTTTGFAMPAEYVEKGECVSGNSVKQNTMSTPGLASVLNEIQVDSLGRPHVIGTTDQATGSTKMHAMKLTAAGLGVTWSRIYGGGHSDRGFALVPTNDRNYTGDYWFTLFGTAGSFGPSPDLYAVGIDPNGVSGCFEDGFDVSEHDPLFPTIKFIPQMADFLSDRGIAAVTAIHKENDPVCECGGERLRMQGGASLSDGTTPPPAGSPVAPSCR